MIDGCIACAFNSKFKGSYNNTYVQWWQQLTHSIGRDSTRDGVTEGGVAVCKYSKNLFIECVSNAGL